MSTTNHRPRPDARPPATPPPMSQPPVTRQSEPLALGTAAPEVEWLTFREVATRLGVSPNRVRNLVRDRQLFALRPDGARESLVPAAFLLAGQIVPGLPGTLTLLADDGFTDEEAWSWLTTEDPSLPGRPIDALRANRGTEVRRRAQALA